MLYIAGCSVSSTTGTSLIPAAVQSMVIFEELEDISSEIGGEVSKPEGTCGTVVLKEKGNGCIGGGGERGPSSMDQNSSPGRRKAKNGKKNKARKQKEITSGHRPGDDAEGVETEGYGGEFVLVQSTK